MPPRVCLDSTCCQAHSLPFMCRTEYGQGFNLHSFYIQPYCRSFLKVNMYGYYRVSFAHLPATASQPCQQVGHVSVNLSKPIV